MLHKGVTGDPEAVTAREGFKIATVNGARALCLENTGAIAPGMKADLAILSLDAPNANPLGDPYSALAYSLSGTETETVLVGGKILMENREFKTIDRDRVLYEVKRIIERIGLK